MFHPHESPLGDVVCVPKYSTMIGGLNDDAVAIPFSPPVVDASPFIVTPLLNVTDPLDTYAWIASLWITRIII